MLAQHGLAEDQWCEFLGIIELALGLAVSKSLSFHHLALLMGRSFNYLSMLWAHLVVCQLPGFCN